MNSECPGNESSSSSQAVGRGFFGVALEDIFSHPGSGEFLDPSEIRGSDWEQVQQFTQIFSEEAQTRCNGIGSSTKANYWLEDLRDRMTSHNVPQHLRVELAKSFLDGEAYEWWTSSERIYFFRGMLMVVLWIWFEDQFHLYFSNLEHRQVQRRILIHLRQGQQSVTEYNNRFLFLSRYAPDIVADCYLHCRLYVDGLDQDLIPEVEGPDGLRLNYNAGDLNSLMQQAIQAEKCHEDTAPPLQQRSNKGDNQEGPSGASES